MRRESIILTDSILQESKYLFKKKLTNCPKYSWCSAKESSVLSKRVVVAKQKNRRCFLKEATMLRGSSQYTLRNHLTAMPWEIVVW